MTETGRDISSMIETNNNKQWLEEMKAKLWSSSPYQKGELVNIHPHYTGGVFKDELVEIIDIGPKQDGSWHEYNCKFAEGRTMWLKGHALIRPGDTYTRSDYDLCCKID